MDKQAEERIERRLRQLFSDGMPKTAVDGAGLQTRGSFLRERPASPFRRLQKRARVAVTRDDAGVSTGDGEKQEGEREEEREEEKEEEKEEVQGAREVGVCETVGGEVEADTTECCAISRVKMHVIESAEGKSGSSEGSGSGSEEAGSEEAGSEEAGSEDSEEAEDDSGEGDGDATEDVGEERRRVFRRLVETNRQYRERLLRG